MLPQDVKNSTVEQDKEDENNPVPCLTLYSRVLSVCSTDETKK